jgi:uncharacterized protein (TIGR02271 family)
MMDQTAVNRLYECEVVDPHGENIGSVKQVWLDENSGRPLWAAVHTGLFGLKESLVPIQDAQVQDRRLRVPVDKRQVKDAPRIETGTGHITDAEQAELYQHYGMIPMANTGEHDRMERPADGRRHRSASGPDGEHVVTRSEERLKVGKKQVETGQVRLVKHVVTEQQQVSVPVSHEEVRVEREPIAESERGRVEQDDAFRDGHTEMTLHAERPVVEKETVPVERVRMGKETVTEQRDVGGEIRKEQIEIDDEVGNPRHRAPRENNQ